jgi:hypothetical protein
MNEPTYTGPLEPVVHNVLQAVQGYFIRTGRHPTPRDTTQIMREILPSLPEATLTGVSCPTVGSAQVPAH